MRAISDAFFFFFFHKPRNALVFEPVGPQLVIMVRLTSLRARACTPSLRRPCITTGLSWTTRRWRATLSPTVAVSQPLRQPSQGSWDQDDHRLRQIFDHPNLDAKPTASPLQNVGLFRNRYLTRPAGFPAFAKINVSRSQRLVQEVLTASSVEEYRRIVLLMDRLSDLLCRVLDLCDFVRVSHPDVRFQTAAEKAWNHVYHYMNELNTEPGLSKQLRTAMENPDVTRHWTDEEMATAEVLNMDFIKSAITLPRHVRDSVVDVAQKISEAGSTFMAEMEPAEHWVRFPTQTVRQSEWAGSNKYVHVYSAKATEGMQTVPNESVRKHLMYGMKTASKYTIETLERLVRLRAKLARLTGFQSYAHLALRDRMMAKTPDNVRRFLTTMCEKNLPLVEKEKHALLAAKHRHLGDGSEHLTLQPWDRDYYMQKLSRKELGTSGGKHLNRFFSIGVVMRGLSRLFTKLFGIRFIPAETGPGETWAPEVRRLDVVSDTEGHVAVLYCDLFHRLNKNPNPAHFTLRCSRAIQEVELEEFAAGAAVQGTDDPLALPRFETPEEAANDGMSTSRHGGVLKQLPTIALVCDFQPKEPGVPSLLSFNEVETLFHEMGHAIHSILARTKLQNVAGTRCPTDFAELPSTLLEHFVSDNTVLGMFAEHHATGEPLPFDFVRRHAKFQAQFTGIETERHILLAMYDQELYATPREGFQEQRLGQGEAAADCMVDSTALYHELQRRYCIMPPDPPGTSWQGFFGHLYGYGATYYSYLFDRVLAGRVWNVVFRRGEGGKAVDRDLGERLKEGILRWGGSRDPWHMLADTLRDEEIRAGDEKAMARVGSWSLAGG